MDLEIFYEIILEFKAILLLSRRIHDLIKMYSGQSDTLHVDPMFQDRYWYIWIYLIFGHILMFLIFENIRISYNTWCLYVSSRTGPLKMTMLQTMQRQSKTESVVTKRRNDAWAICLLVKAIFVSEIKCEDTAEAVKDRECCHQTQVERLDLGIFSS